jgi:hypothetical protein
MYMDGSGHDGRQLWQRFDMDSYYLLGCDD